MPLLQSAQRYKTRADSALGRTADLERSREATADQLKAQKKQAMLSSAGTGAGIGMMAGMQAGSVGGPVGALIGAGVGLLAGSLL